MGWKWKMWKMKVIQSCPTLWSSAGQNTEVSSRSFLWGMFPSGDLPNPGWNPSLSQRRQILYQLNHQVSPQIVCSVQFSSVTQSCPTLCDPMNCSTPGLPVHHQLPEFTQTHVHWVGDAIQSSQSLLFPSPPTLTLVTPLYWASQVALVGKWDAG